MPRPLIDELVEMCVGLARFGKTISAQKSFDDPHVRDMRMTPTQAAQTGLFCLSGSSGLSGLTKQTRQTK